jgi:hypothetical protein
MSGYQYLANDADLIRRLVDEGRTVYVNSVDYFVNRYTGQYYITCRRTGHAIMLTRRDGSLNATEFFTIS